MLTDLSLVVRMGRWYDFLNMQTCPNMLSVLEMDSADFSTLVSDPKAARQFRAATVEYTRSSLTGDESLEHSISTTSSIITSFKTVAEAISKSYTPGEQSPRCISHSFKD